MDDWDFPVWTKPVGGVGGSVSASSAWIATSKSSVFATPYAVAAPSTKSSDAYRSLPGSGAREYLATPPTGPPRTARWYLPGASFEGVTSGRSTHPGAAPAAIVPTTDC